MKIKKKTKKAPIKETFGPCGCMGDDVENFSDEIRNMPVSELLNQIKGNNNDLYRSLVTYIRDTYQEFDSDNIPEGPPAPLVTLDPPDSSPMSDIIGKIGDAIAHIRPHYMKGIIGIGKPRGIMRVKKIDITKRPGSPAQVRTGGFTKRFGESNRKKNMRDKLMIESYKILRNKNS